MSCWRPVVLILLAKLLVGGSGCGFQSPPPPRVSPSPAPDPVHVTEQVHDFCGKCHAYPPAESFPRSAWKEEVERGYFFFGKSNLKLSPPPINAVVNYYETRAPETLPRARIEWATTPLPVQFAQHSFPNPPQATPPAISHVSLVHLRDAQRLDILACEMRHGLIMSLAPYEPSATWKVLGKVKNPSHAEVRDLDGDGILDILVADLGSFPPTDRLSGSVVWLRGNREGDYTPITLLDQVGRVADVQTGDFNGDSKLDLVVAVFGWQENGEIIILENTTTEWDRPEFTPHIVDNRRGGIHVPVIDLNGDGKLDVVALIAQENEEICALVNRGEFKFESRPLYNANNPSYGSSGIQLVDLNGDGHIDVLYTNGDVLDSPHLLKPYHSVQWLKNKGDGNLEFEHRPIAPMYGVHRAVAADLCGNGRLDILAVAYLPEEHFPQRQAENLDALVIFEQTSPGEFVRHTLESKKCDYVTCAAGDVFGTGRNDIVTANFTMDERLPSLHVLKNLGQPSVEK